MSVSSVDEHRMPLVDARLSQALWRRANELIGIGFLGLALVFAGTLVSYDISDPSPFNATTADAKNWLGAPGAILADTLMRYAGLGAWTLVAFFLVWGLRLMLHAGASRIWARMVLLPFVFGLTSMFASMHVVFDSWPFLATGLGGVLGDEGAAWLLGWVPGDLATGLTVASLSLAALVLGLGALMLGMTVSEGRRLVRWLMGSFVVAVLWTVHLLMRRGQSGAREAQARWREWRARPRSEVMEPAVPTGQWRRSPEPAVTAVPAEPEADPTATGASLRTVFRRLSEDGAMPGAGDDDTATAHGTDLPEDDAYDRVVEPMAPALSAEPDDLSPKLAVARVASPRKSKKAQAERQPTLALDGESGPDGFEIPPLSMLQMPAPVIRGQLSDTALEDNARMLETVLEDYGVRGEIVAVRPGPVVTLYELEPAPGLKASRVIGLADDIARSMSALSARVSTVPGRSIIGIELPNSEREKVWLRDIFETRDYGDARFALTLALGKDISGAPVVANLAKMPHLLIAGTTGSGKSVAINTMILSLLYRLSPQKCRLIMIDPKMLELSVYDNIPHLLSPVVTDPKKAVVALKWVVAEMEDRYRKMSKMGVRSIDGYNARVRDAIEKGEAFSRTVQTGFDDATGDPVYETETFEPQELPYIVVIVDEMADLMMVAGKEIEACIQRLAQMARASGIHLIMATQRPSVDVITGTIKANFPTRISFQVTSKIDSRTILGEQGAEQLLGMGDMLYMAGGGRITRVHGPFVSDEEVEEVVNHLKSQGVPDYVSAVTDGVDDEAQAEVDAKLGLAAAGDSDATLYDHAVAIVARDRKCSTSYIQRKLAIGYNKAARLVEQMEEQGVVTSANAIGKREILIAER